MLTDAQARLVYLDSKKAEIEAYYEELDQVLRQVQSELGTDGYFQDPGSGLVFKIVKPEGTFVLFKDVKYLRTKRAGEDRGSLSVKEAQAAGFKVS